MRLRIGYLLLAFGLLALIALTVVRMGRERQFYELQLRQQATAIEAGLREKWKAHLLAVAKHDRLPKDFVLHWDRAGKILRTPFFPEPGIQLEWAEYREALKKADAATEKTFLEKALLLRRSWDRVLAVGEWQRAFGEPPKLELEGYERTVLDAEAREAYRTIIALVEGGRDFTFARDDADFDQAFFRTTPEGDLEAFLPSIDALRTEILPTFIAQNRLSDASFGTTALDIHFPEFQNIAANGLHGIDTLLLTASAILLAIGVGLTATGVREQRNILLRRVSFLNQVVHELKTPLAGLRLSAQLIRRSGPSERNLQAIDESIMRLDRLFDDIVQINRTEKPAELAPFSAAELNRLIETLCHVEFAGVAMIDGQATKPILSEVGRLRVLLRNLFSNGVKYGGQIVVTIRETSDRTELVVRDQGPGVTVADAPKIFDEFFRAESARKIESGGLGLGLSLVKKLAFELHSSVRLANPGATGAVFIVSLPRAKKFNSGVGMSQRVLVVEDDKILSNGLRQALEEEGYAVSVAMDGDMGLHLAKTVSPDLLILDIMMPQLNGFEVITELRRSGDNVPVIVLSARTDSRDKVRGLDLGADDYVAKPFDLEELLARVRRHLGKRSDRDQVFGTHVYEWKTRQLLTLDERKPVVLTAKERKLLEFFLKREGQVASREQVLDGVWGDDYDGTDRTVDNLIVALRKKVGVEHLLTERGLGYRFVTKP